MLSRPCSFPGSGRLLSLNRKTIAYQSSQSVATEQSKSESNQHKWFAKSIGALAAGSALLWASSDLLKTAYAATANANSKSVEKFIPPTRPDLPTFKLDDVKKHGKGADRMWVVYKQGVYDITEFLQNHPGGDKILMAAGGSVEPFWALYAQHKTEEVMEILEELRIGNVDPDDLAKAALKKTDNNENNPYANDPERHPALLVNQETPFNAESPPSLMMDHYLTPNDIFFVRNHMPVPDVDASKHRVKIEGLGVTKPLVLTVDDIKSGEFEEVSVTTVIQCGGNRRADMNRFKKVQGLMWEGTAIGNAKWTGIRLRDVLLKAGVDPSDTRIKHVHFEGADHDASGACYGGSVPFEKAMSPETVIAYQMNGQPIPRDHGYPLRLIAPGILGARQVKWLVTVRPSDVESPAHWQQKDYKVFPSSVQIGDPLDFSTVHSINEYPVQSAICVPAPNTKVERSDGEVDLAGYAWSGGGRGIVRVEVSTDGGQTWQCAELEQDPDQDVHHMWGWTLWRATVPIPEGKESFQVVCKATDRAYNTQPETPGALWNVRGLLNTAWHRINIQVIED
uniref:Sulfite oxidase n=1 Tax=Panagrellus redivivus TaxID=6233 RepID=A0A7E4VDB3_PANRE